MDGIHAGGITFILKLQYYFKDYSEMMLFLSHIGDPRNAFLVYFPIAYFIHHSVGKRVVMVAAVSEWLNAIFKWLLHGQRPYWWVHESSVYEIPPQLDQFRLTCETGPGSPSGHAMVTSSVLFLLVSEFIYYRKITRFPVKLVCWFIFGLIMLAVNLSRCFIATHFPHQVIAGVAVGILLAVTFNSISTTSLSLKHYAVASALILSSTVTAYFIIILLGFDPVWSISFATKWCAKPEWIHLDTTLFYSIVRDCSCLLGMGIGVYLAGEDNSEWNLFSRLFQIILSLTAAQIEEIIVVPHEPQLVFYTLASIKYIILFIVIINIIPKISELLMRLVFGTRKKDA